MVTPVLDFSDSLPDDAHRALLIGRVWQPNIGPTLVAFAEGGLYDITRLAPTASQLFERNDAASAVRAALSNAPPRIASFDDVLVNSDESTRDRSKPWLLAPCDLQVVKASGEIGRAHV